MRFITVHENSFVGPGLWDWMTRLVGLGDSERAVNCLEGLQFFDHMGSILLQDMKYMVLTWFSLSVMANRFMEWRIPTTTIVNSK